MKKCIICEEINDGGIHLHQSYICGSCEHNIVHTDVRADKYRYYVEKLKNISYAAI